MNYISAYKFCKAVAMHIPRVRRHFEYIQSLEQEIDSIKRSDREKRNLISILYSHQEYYSDLIINGKYRQAASLTLAAGCPIHCRYCAQKQFLTAYYAGNNPVKMLTYENFLKIAAKIPSDVIISFTGFVEPFSNPDCLKMILHSLETHKTRVYSTMYNVGIADYKLFCDHPNLTTFDIHIPDNQYNTVFPITDDYKELLNYIMKYPPRHATYMVCCLGVNGGPRKEISEIVEPYVQEGNGTAIDSMHSLVYKNYIYHGSADLECLSDCGRMQEPGAGIGLILPNGDVTVCSRDYELTSIVGNIFEFESWNSLMNADKRKKFIQGLYDPSLNTICRRCEHAVKVYNHRSSKGGVQKGYLKSIHIS